jgi:diaminopimelate epimerase
MDETTFYKYSGHGNDFVIIDNWRGHVPENELSKRAKLLCRLKFGVGADGVVYISEGPETADFAVRFFNSDGSEAEMCGNASRCVAHMAYVVNIASSQMIFHTNAGEITAFVKDHLVSVRLPNIGEPGGVALVDVDGFSQSYHRINTGVAHAVTWVDNLESVDVLRIGKVIRNHASFAPGANVDFVEVIGNTTIAVRTYEKGVEGETLACGTGCVAAALLSASQGYVKGDKILCKTRGGEDLTVRFEGPPEKPSAVYLEGAVRHVFSGTLGPDILLPTKRAK